MDTCIHYNHSLREIILPSYKILYKFCSSKEKTTLFLISSLRLFIIYRIFSALYSHKLIIFTNDHSVKSILFVICFVYLLMNIIYLIIIPFKVPDYDQFQLEEEAELIAIALKQHEIEKTQAYKAKEEAQPLVES